MLTINECRVIAERAYGPEKAKAATLAKIFGVPHQTIHAILRRAVCKRCGRAICHHSDLEYQGLA